MTMIKGFWEKLNRPILALAPMANVTDAAFREIIAKYGKPDVMWTEFVSCDGLLSPGREHLLLDLQYSELQRPIVGQIFGSKPEHFYEVARLLQQLGFDGIDINMGCPDRAVEKQGAGAALVKTPRLAQEIIAATKRGAGNLPVSVKTRIGYNQNTLSEWIKYLLESEPAAITIHARTRKEMSAVPAHWDAVREAVQIARESQSETLILGNGDLSSIPEALQKVTESGAAGIMVGRGIFGNPWFFDRNPSPEGVSLQQRFRVMQEHTRLFEKLFAGRKSFDVMKKHYKAYISDFPGARELRANLMLVKNADEAEGLLTPLMMKLEKSQSFA
jgi:nifR3 family TIM-barrel protein